jgi:CheY-like chemotaxis protein
MPQIFERFRQADMCDSRAHSGLGIGLALSRELVELQGGTIAAHSEGEGMGAVFRVRLPWVDGQAAPEPSSSAGSAATFEEARLQGITVLLVEDDASTRDAMQWMLTRAGTTVVRATSGPEALELLDAGQQGSDGAALPDVILSDLGLPGMSGYELIRRIVQRQRDRGQPPIPACAVSAHARTVDKLRAIEAGFDMYLVKPVTPEKLIAAVEDLKAVAATHVSAEPRSLVE